MKRRIVLGSIGAMALFGAGLLVGANKFGQPKSVLHVITVQWKADATDAQKKSAIDGVKTMAGAIPGITNVWTKTLKVQPDAFNNVLVMEFKDEAAFNAYADAAAHKDWEKVYLPIRERSTTHDATN